MFKRIFMLVFLLLVSAVFITVQAQTGGGNPTPIFTIDGLLSALTPLIIFAVTWIVQRIKPTLVGWNIVWVVVPILSVIASAVLVLIDQATSFWSQFLWNFLSVFVAQLVIQLSGNKMAANQKQKNIAQQLG